METNERSIERWLSVIRTEGDRLASMPPELLDVAVPALAEWTIERVVRHVGRVHRWVTGLFAAPPDADPDRIAAAAPALPRGPDALSAYRESLDELLDVLERTDPSRDVASFIGRTQASFWIRRQAHETTVHRFDADDARCVRTGGVPASADPIAAADGIGEWFEVFAATHQLHTDDSDDSPLRGHSIALRCDDVPVGYPALFLFGFDSSPPAMRWANQGVEHTEADFDARADVILGGSAEELLLTLWRRRPLTILGVTGARVVAETMYDTMRF